MSSHRPALETIHHAPSWRLASDRVEAWLTRDGGHLGPVRFTLGGRIVEPFAVAPWAPSEIGRDDPAVLRHLRGDFFCCPFGGNERPWRGERHPVHGETAGGRWHSPRIEIVGTRTAIEAELRATIRPGRVVKRVEVRASETNLYCRHVLRGMTGPMCPGHHAMLRFPELEGSGLVALAPFSHGRVVPVLFEDPARGGRQSLRPGARFSTLERVGRTDGGVADLSRYPARAGFEDLVMVVARAGTFAWSAVSFPTEGFLWFALKDPRTLRSTVLWHSNGGRDYPPWSGRHRGVLGIEEVTAYYHFGLAASAAPNPLSRAGVATAVRLRPDRPLVVSLIMGVVAIPEVFGHVARVRRRKGGVEFIDRAGHSVRTRVDWGFLYEKGLNPNV
jgi:hypothetical protein